jgi:secreted PhoX family phosphatase
MASTLHPDNDLTINPTHSENINDIIEAHKLSRRSMLKGTFGATTVAIMGGTVLNGLGSTAEAAPAPTGSIGFTSVPANIVPMADAVAVPAGYNAEVLIAWGDSLTPAPHWDPAVEMDETTQLRTYGAHTDGMHYFPFPVNGNNHGLLVANHEYNDPGLVHSTTTYATDVMTLERARTQQAAHGVSVVEIRKNKSGFDVKRHSLFNRRITGNTPCKVTGPAAGHPMMKTSSDPAGKHILGTLNNCANGYTPWGTYLTCEENWNGYFGSTAEALATAPLTAHENRYGISRAGFGYRWHEVDDRFDIRKNANEPNRFGWVVEIDPFDPTSKPVKRTALGRFKHESAAVVVDANKQVAVYMGDDERNEYVYKFVSKRKYSSLDPRANRELLAEGTLYVAKFNADGTGQWLPLKWNKNGLTPENGFADQGEVVIKCRQAADRVGATMMDRPEWIAVHPKTREVYLTLTNNNRRGGTPASVNAIDGTTTAATARPPVDAANPRLDNRYGHIIRWRESCGNVAADTFAWDIFAECGDSLDADAHHQGNILGDDYGAPDGLAFDKHGRLWIQTDQPGDALGDWANIGGNVMMCANPATGETRRFLTSPKHCEVTGITWTPDGRTCFVGIQHPGEDWSGSFVANSTWPDSGANGPTTASHKPAAKPRSAVVAITREDGGVIGT